MQHCLLLYLWFITKLLYLLINRLDHKIVCNSSKATKKNAREKPKNVYWLNESEIHAPLLVFFYQFGTYHMLRKMYHRLTVVAKNFSTTNDKTNSTFYSIANLKINWKKWKCYFSVHKVINDNSFSLKIVLQHTYRTVFGFCSQ